MLQFFYASTFLCFNFFMLHFFCYSFFNMWNEAVHYSYKHYVRKEKQRKELYEKIRNARDSGLIPHSEVSH
ncbi:hypothetical protein [Plasmodium yoelii yoelii]|uniref:Uncharacterized protein n=1 Tax=Plasmodium yoelii yoelii TaxID=73239 RepID=Q7RG57_PLAYO|nr:hypothetical protein [Plasmodium yoelii yoelii]